MAEIGKEVGENWLFVVGRDDNSKPPVSSARSSGLGVTPAPERNDCVVEGDQDETCLCRQSNEP